MESVLLQAKYFMIVVFYIPSVQHENHIPLCLAYRLHCRIFTSESRGTSLSSFEYCLALNMVFTVSWIIDVTWDSSPGYFDTSFMG